MKFHALIYEGSHPTSRTHFYSTAAALSRPQYGSKSATAFSVRPNNIVATFYQSLQSCMTDKRDCMVFPCIDNVGEGTSNQKHTGTAISSLPISLRFMNSVVLPMNLRSSGKCLPILLE